jgi:hypothetical protein
MAELTRRELVAALLPAPRRSAAAAEAIDSPLSLARQWLAARSGMMQA